MARLKVEDDELWPDDEPLLSREEKAWDEVCPGGSYRLVSFAVVGVFVIDEGGD